MTPGQIEDCCKSIESSWQSDALTHAEQIRQLAFCIRSLSLAMRGKDRPARAYSEQQLDAFMQQLCPSSSK